MVKRKKKVCPDCAQRLLRSDFGTRWPPKARMIIALAGGVTLVWAPAVFILGIGMGFLKFGGGKGIVVLGATALAPLVAIGGFAGRPVGYAGCPACGWSGSNRDVKKI